MNPLDIARAVLSVLMTLDPVLGHRLAVMSPVERAELEERCAMAMGREAPRD